MSPKKELEMLRHTNKVQAEELGKMKTVITKIASMGAGLKEEVIDWKNIGRNATYTAREFLRPKCRTCGK